MTDYVVDFNLDDEDLNADYELDEGEVFNAILLLEVVGSLWGNISGDINNQTDLIELFDLKADKTEVESVTGALADSITAVSDNLQSEATTRADNDVILQNNINNLSDSLTAEIGNRTSADTILQGNINSLDDKVDSLTGALDDRIDTLSDTVTANYNTLDDKIDSVNGALSDSIVAVDDKYNSITGGLSDDIDALESVVSANFITLSDSISDETTARQNADSIIGDSITALDNKFDSITGGLSDSISAIDSTINNYGDIVTYNAADFATSLQGALADTALQPNDDISLMNNNVGFITAADLPTVNNSSIVFQKNGTNFDTITLNQSNNDTINLSIPTTAADVNALPNTTNINDLTTTTQQAALNSGANTTNIGQIATNTNAISTEVTDRQNADLALQNQIDAIVSSSDVFDIVGTYAELQAYDIATVPVNDIIKVLVDSTHNNAATYYRCVENGGVKSWSYIGSEGAYYTKGEANGLFVPQSRTVNGKALSNNISLTASDVGALPDNTVIPIVNNSTITIEKNGAAVDTFTLNQATAKTINITVPTDTNDLTNGAGFISGISYADVIAALGFTPYNSTNPNGYITSAALAGYATENFVTSQGYITGIDSTDVITALTYTPYDASNPDGYITSAALANYVTNTSLATTLTDYVTNSVLTTTLADYALLTDIPTVDQTFDGTSPNAQSGVAMAGELNNYIDKTTNQSITSNKTFTNNSVLDFQNGAIISCSSGCGRHNITDFWLRGQSTYWGYPRSIVNDYNGIVITKKGSTQKTDFTIDGNKIYDADTGLVPYQRLNGVTDNNSGSLKFWTGTKAQYDAIVTKDSDTLYNVEDTTSPIISILDSLYPVGAIYIGTMNACPLATLGIGTWQLVSSGKVLQGVSSGQTVGSNVAAGLPNITGVFAVRSAWSDGGAAGAFYVTSNQYQDADTEYGGSAWRGEYGFDASRSSSIYGNSATVQPPAYLVNIWERIA